MEPIHDDKIKEGRCRLVRTSPMPENVRRCKFPHFDDHGTLSSFHDYCKKTTLLAQRFFLLSSVSTSVLRIICSGSTDQCLVHQPLTYIWVLKLHLQTRSNSLHSLDSTCKCLTFFTNLLFDLETAFLQRFPSLIPL